MPQFFFSLLGGSKVGFVGQMLLDGLEDLDGKLFHSIAPQSRRCEGEESEAKTEGTESGTPELHSSIWIHFSN